LSDCDNPYIVPVCFGYENQTLYFHSAPEGKKIDILKKNPRVCVEFDINTAVLKAPEACEWGMRYQSVIAYGRAVFLNKPENKHKAFAVIMRHYSDNDFSFNAADLEKTAVIKMNIENLTGKKSGL